MTAFLHTMIRVTDPDATSLRKFYRVQVSYP